MFPAPFIDRGSLQKFRQVLSRMMRSLELILAIRGGYRPGPYKARLAFALAISLAFHAFVLSLRFGIAGFGLPGLALPWAERRAFTSDLSVRLAEAPRAQNLPAPGMAARRPSAVEPLPVQPPAARPPSVQVQSPRTLAAVTPAKSKRVKQRRLRAKAPAKVQPVARAAPKPLPPVAVARPAAPPVEKPAREPAAQAQPELIAQADPQQETFSVPPPAQGVPEPAPVREVAAKQQVEEPPPPVQEQAEPARDPVQADQEAALRAREQEAVKLEQARRQEESRRQDQARAAREALELEARRRAERQAEETARQQAAELARRRALEVEARRQEEAKAETARQQAVAIARQRALELEATRQEEANEARRAMELEARRQAEEAARQQVAARERQRELEAKRAEELATREREARELAERQRAEAQAASQRQREAERLAADSARAALAAAEPGRSAAGTIGSANPPGRDLAAKALDQLRTPGALRAEPQGPRPSAQVPQSPPASAGADNSRRRPVLGGFERDIGLRMYVEGWRWKIERNGRLNYPSGARIRAAENPVVTVAIRRDGSVEDVHIHRSSGQRDLDERVRRIVQLNAPFSAFPPDLARAYDVIEIRRVWVFGDTLGIVEELN